ncbi:MAG: DEAD/DEAH box helicase family protein [Bacillota bacterium]
MDGPAEVCSRAIESKAPPQSLTERMQFRGTWRDYQQRVLDDLDALLSDERIHVVAAPGAGKTVLGLEIMRRLGRSALILAPTRTVRDQWSSRLQELFLPRKAEPGRISNQLSEIGDVSIATYQALHAYWAGDAERFDRLVQRLRALGCITLILDEAHHLRREWWSALEALTTALSDMKIVALTATPPYDAPYSEWARYEAMCGPIDLEIGIPELVRNGDLCPHQDQVVFSNPGQDALALLDRRRERILSLRDELRADSDLLATLEGSPWLQDPGSHVEEILDAPEMLSAILVLLAASGRGLPKPPLKLLGVRSVDVPLLSNFWLQILLEGLLNRFKDLFALPEGRAAHIRSCLEECGLIEGGHVRLVESRSIFTLMADSLAKLGSIVRIAREEATSLGNDLRLVILSDHIRLGEVTRAGAKDYQPAKLGVVPIFETLRRSNFEGQRIAILTGSLVVLPVETIDRLRTLAGRAIDGLQLQKMRGWPDHLVIKTDAELAEHLVELVTTLFCEGSITILIGTQSLLGEGWDAPAVNSLVLASNSAAFMLSNQMRGRAIRIDKDRPHKVANIWHLATVEPSALGSSEFAEYFNWGPLNDSSNLRNDLDLLKRRFHAFVGISNDGSAEIEGGLARLGLLDQIDKSNEKTFAIAKGRHAIADTWKRSLGDAPPRAHVREIASPNYAPRGLAWYDTIQWLGASALSAAAFAATNELRHVQSLEQLANLGTTISGLAFIASLPFLARALWLTLRNGSLEGSARQVASAVLASFYRAELIGEDEYRNARISVFKDLSGICDILVDGVTRANEHALIEAIAEILGPTENPRYLLVRQSWLGPLRRTDYHPVPTVLGARKRFAKIFHREWKARVGSSQLVFTRTPTGRLSLLRARARSFAAGFRRAVDRRSAWL